MLAPVFVFSGVIVLVERWTFRAAPGEVEQQSQTMEDGQHEFKPDREDRESAEI